MRPQPARRWSWPGLAGFVDANFPRIYFQYEELSPIATVTMSAHFHLTAPEFEALGDDYLLVDASAAVAHAGLYDQTVRIWSRNGALVATSTQLAVFGVKSDTPNVAS
jgi:acyl-CoA thioesterase